MTLNKLTIKHRAGRWKIISKAYEFPEEYPSKQAAEAEAERMEAYDRRYGAGGWEYTANPSN